MGDALDDLLDGIGLPSAQPQQDPLDDLLDSVGLPKKPAVHPHRDMSQLGADLRAAGAHPAVGKVDVPDPGFIRGVLEPAATNMAGTALAGTAETVRDAIRAHPTLAAVLTAHPGVAEDAGAIPEGLTRELGGLAEEERSQYLTAHPDNLHAGAAYLGELGINVLPMAAGAPAALRTLGVTGAAPTIGSAVTGALKGAATGAGIGAGLGYLGDYGDTTEGRIDAAIQGGKWGGLMGGVGGLGHAPKIPRAGDRPPGFRTEGVALPGEPLDPALLPKELPEPQAPTAEPLDPSLLPDKLPPAGPEIAAQTSFRGERKAPLLGPRDDMLVAKAPDGSDAGYLWYTKEPGGGFSVRRIETAPEARGQGVARALYQEAATREGPYRGSTAQTPEGAALVARLKETDPSLFLPLAGDPLTAEEKISGRRSMTRLRSEDEIRRAANAEQEAAVRRWARGEGALPGAPSYEAFHPPPIQTPSMVADRIGAAMPPEHLATFVPSTDDAVASPTNAPAVSGALAAAPVADLANDNAGVRHWMLRSALGDGALADRLLTSDNAGLQKIGASIASVAPSIQDGGAELRGALSLAAKAVADAREAGGPGPEMTRVGALLGPDAPVEVHRLASFMVEHGDKPEELGLMLHRAVELQQGAGTQPGAAPPAMDALLQMAADQRQQAGATLPLESAVTIARRPMAEMPVRSTPGQAGFISFQARRWGTSSPIARWFTRDGYWRSMGDAMSKRTADLVRTKDNAVTAEAGRVTRLVRDFGSAFEDHMAVTPAGTPREDVLRYVRQGMEGNNDLSQVSVPLQDAAMAIRAHLDATSQRYAARPDLPPTLRSAIQSNVGTYLPRTFEAFTDPKGWEKKLRAPAALAHSQAHLIDDAAAWARQQHPQWTDDNARGYAWHLVLADPNAAYAVASPQRGAIGAESRGNLIARKGLPAEIDALLGLHPDPALSFQLSQMRAIHSLETYDLHSTLKQEGSLPGPNGEPPVFVDLHDELHPIRVGGTGPLAPMYTSPEIAAMIRGTENVSPAFHGWMRTYMKVNGAIKAGMTAGNFPMGVMRNLLTAPFQLLAQGHFIQAFPLKYAYETARHIPLAIEANLGTKRGAVLKMFHGLVGSMDTAFGTKVGDHISTAMKDLRPEIEKLTELGVFGQSTTTNDLRYYLGQQEGEPIPSRLGRGVRTIGAFWSGEHDLTKHASWSAEVQNLRWANPAMTLSEIEKMAAERVIATMPTRSEVSPALRAVRSAPLVAPFPTWAAEYWRNAKNNIGIAYDDLRNPNPRMKVLGGFRTAGIAASWYLAAGGMSKMLQMLWGTSDQDADALRQFAPVYHKNTELAVAERRGGQVRYFSASPLMPQSGISGAVLAMYRGIAAGHPRDGIIDGIEEALRPFTDTEFLAKAGLELHANRTQEGGVADWAMDLAREHPTIDEGRTIYERGAPLSTTGAQVGSYLWHNLAPGTPREVERLARATGVPVPQVQNGQVTMAPLSNENSRGKRYTVEDELAAMLGVRFSTLNTNRGLMDTGAGLKRAYDDSTKYFSIERGGSRNDPATVLAARDAANAKWKNALEQAKAKVDAARQLRISDAAIRANLLRVGVKPNIIGQLMSGNFRPLPLNRPYREPIDYVGQDQPSP